MKRILFSSLLVFLLAVPAWSQVTFEARIDTNYLVIGQQRELQLEVTCGAQQKMTWPEFKPYMPLKDGVELVDFLGSDTTFLNEGKRQQVRQRWTITAFDSALVYLPPFQVEVDGKTYESKPLALKIVTMPVDTVHVDQFFPNKDIQNNPFSWSDWTTIIWLSVLTLLLIGALVYVAIRWHQNKPIIRIVRRVVKLPPHQVAMQEIERIKGERKWAEEDSKEYYTQLTDTLRTYIRERYGFNATEMTSSEIIDHLTQNQNEEALSELRQLFQTADLVKFAKWTTLINENDMNLVNAIDFINQTKVEPDPNAKPEPEEITIEEKQNRTRSIVMRTSMAVLAVASLALLVYIGWLVADLIL